jgi:soluble lytic murein transglycosylase-like protein
MNLRLSAVAAAMVLASTAAAVASPHHSGTAQGYIVAQAAKYGISHAVIERVARRESGFRCSPGNPRYHGPLQISYQSARALGYRGSAGGLNNCSAGLEYGLRHLALCAHRTGQNPGASAHCHAVPGRYGVRVSWAGME